MPSSPSRPTIIPDAVILIDGDTISAVGPREGVALPAGAQQIDSKGKFILPGHIDTHVHFFQSGIPVAAGVLYPSTHWLLSPMLAALAMALSSVSVVTNALRLRGFKVERSA